MPAIFRSAIRRLLRPFIAGVLTILPLVITIIVIAWVGSFLQRFLGPDSVIGRGIRGLGLNFVSDATLAYGIGVIVVIGLIFGLGILVDLGARTSIQNALKRLLIRIPVVGSIYDTSRQLVSMLDKRDPADLQGMSAVFCQFAASGGVGVLALLVSPKRFTFNDREFLCVIVPTAPVPVGGGMLFVPVEQVQPTDLSVEALMGIYVSMGISAEQILQSPPAGPAT